MSRIERGRKFSSKQDIKLKEIELMKLRYPNVKKFVNSGFDKTPAELLILELQSQINKEKIMGMCDTTDENFKDVNRIVFLLKQLEGFKKFLIFNCIDEEALRIAANHFTYKFVEKGKHIFKKGDKSDHFFVIIQGKVSICKVTRILEEIQPNERVKNYGQNDLIFSTKSLNRKNTIINSESIGVKELIKEEEILCKHQGECFGEWGLINEARRVSSAIAAEDTHFFVLNKQAFKISFQKSLTKTEFEKKNFIISRISPYAEYSNMKFQIEYEKILPIFPYKGQIIFSENTHANRLFLIFMGCCVLEKNGRDQNLIYNNDSGKKNMCLLKIDKGDIIGLEALFEEKYSFTLRCDTDYTMIFSIEVEKLEVGLKQKIKESLSSLYKHFKDNVNSLMEKHRFYNKKLKINYKKDIHSKEIKNHKLIEEGENDLTNYVQRTIQDIFLNNPKISDNEIKSYKLIDGKKCGKKKSIEMGKDSLTRSFSDRKLDIAKNPKRKMILNSNNVNKIFNTEYTNLETYQQTTQDSYRNDKKIKMSMNLNLEKIRAKSSMVNTRTNLDIDHNKEMITAYKANKTKRNTINSETLQNEAAKIQHFSTHTNFKLESPKRCLTQNSPFNHTKHNKGVSLIITNTQGSKILRNLKLNLDGLNNIFKKDRLRLFSSYNSVKKNLAKIKNENINFVSDWRSNMFYTQGSSKKFNYDTGCFAIPLVSYISNTNFNIFKNK